MKKILFALILSLGIGKATAQSFTDGVYNTNYGTINLTFEQGNEFPNGGIFYGDYKGIGTITGSTANVGKEIVGNFHNGAAEGKFIFFAPSGKQHFFDSGITSFNGNWGYSTDNKYSTNPDHIWKATSKVGGKDAIKNVTNVWSGKWNTTDGAMYLMQIGNKITGTYKGVGTVEATYNPATRLLKGTFTNNNFNKTGYIEFYFEGNSFKGKWGWTEAMTEGNWDGTKDIKNNKELSKMTTTSTSTTQNNTTTNNTIPNIQIEKYRVNITMIDVAAKDLPVAAATQFWWFYGFSGVRMYKVTSSGREEIKSFGNKNQYFFNKTEDNPLENNNKTPFNFSNTPDFYRDFEIKITDLNNPNISFEIELWHHIKVKVAGPNKDYGKTSKTLDFKSLVNKGAFHLCDNCTDSQVYFKITKQ